MIALPLLLFSNIISLFLILSGGVGFDINCGVRLLRTNLDEKDVQPVKEQLAQVSAVPSSPSCKYIDY